ncbi:MAG: hypothetical protein ACO2ZM_08580 [Francisellaceae bacterium]
MSEINRLICAKIGQIKQSSSSLGDDPCDHRESGKDRMCLGKSRQ